MEKRKMTLEDAGLPLFLLSKGKIHDTETFTVLLSSVSSVNNLAEKLTFKHLVPKQKKQSDILTTRMTCS